MQDNYYVPGEAAAVEQGLSPKTEKALKWIILVTSVILAAELVWLFVVSPSMPLSRVDISGFQGLDKNLILAQAGIDDKSSYISVNPRAIENALMLLPPIESARVEKRFPGSVTIDLTGRKALAASLIQTGGRYTLAVFDKQGVVFKEERRNAEAASLPLITGLFPADIRPGTRPEPLYYSFLSRLEHIRGSAPELLAVISEIRINRRDFGGFDLILYPSYYPVRILAGADLDENMLRYMLLMMDVLIVRDPRIEEIDFRAGMASYTVKEASSG